MTIAAPLQLAIILTKFGVYLKVGILMPIPWRGKLRFAEVDARPGSGGQVNEVWHRLHSNPRPLQTSLLGLCVQPRGFFLSALAGDFACVKLRRLE